MIKLHKAIEDYLKDNKGVPMTLGISAVYCEEAKDVKASLSYIGVNAQEFFFDQDTGEEEEILLEQLFNLIKNKVI